MNKPTAAEAFVAPDLALLPALLVLLDCALVLLRVQHPRLDDPDGRADTPPLLAARAVSVQIESTRRALLRYVRLARRAVRDVAGDDGQLPF